MPGDPLITLLTDYGTQDIYAGVLHGVILGLAPRARIVDLTHSVPPQAIGQAGLLLAAAAPYFPPGTVHVAVVDPGVGSSRRILCASASGALFLAPDNGLLEEVLAADPRAELWSVEDRRLFLPKVSLTFHGRDIFAPVAARLATGLDPAKVGPAVSDPVRSRLPAPRLERGVLRGQVAHVDRFGNLLTTIRPDDLTSPVAWVRTRGTTIQGPACSTYSDRPAGALLALSGSSGRLEVSINAGDAAARLGSRVGDPVEVGLLERSDG